MSHTKSDSQQQDTSTEAMSAHTPTPWKTERTENGLRIIGGLDNDVGGMVVALVVDGWGLAEEDAAHIVRAVNGHDALYAASKEIADFETCEERGIFLDDRPSRDVAFDELILTARAAIAKAEGRA